MCDNNDNDDVDNYDGCVAFSFKFDDKEDDNNNDNENDRGYTSRVRDTAIRREILPSQKIEDYFQDWITNDDMLIFIPVLTKIFNNFGGRTIDDIKARIINKKCFKTQTITHVQKTKTTKKRKSHLH